MNTKTQLSVVSLGAAVLLAAWVEAVSAVPAVKCGDGLLQAGETCEACPSDCKPASCKASKQQRRVAIDIVTPSNLRVNAVVARVAYQSDRVTLGAPGDGPEVKKRITPRQDIMAMSANNLGYAVRVVLVRGQRFEDGAVAEVKFDACAGAKLSSDNLSCVVESCSSGGGPAECTCSVRVL